MFNRKKKEPSIPKATTISPSKIHYKEFKGVYYAYDVMKQVWIVTDKEDGSGVLFTFNPEFYRLDQAIEEFKRLVKPQLENPIYPKKRVESRLYDLPGIGSKEFVIKLDKDWIIPKKKNKKK